MTSKVVAIVPARAGSKGLPGKNVREFCGVPLYRRSVDVALAAGIAQVLISTDIDEIFHHALPAGVTAVRRPAELAGDKITMAAVLKDLLDQDGLSDSTVVLLQPTSPLRSKEHVFQGIRLYSEGKYSMVMGVCQAQSSVLKWGFIQDDHFVPLSKPEYCFANRQMLPPVYRPNGALYVFGAREFLALGDFPARSIGTVVMGEKESLDIDTLAEFLQCENMVKEAESNEDR